jgi:hypothetical protein
MMLLLKRLSSRQRLLRLSLQRSRKKKQLQQKPHLKRKKLFLLQMLMSQQLHLM